MIGLAIVFIVLGILIKYGKMYFLIAGYNTMSKEEKEKYDIVGIANIFRNTILGMALTILIGFFAAEVFDNPDIESIAFFGSLLIGLLYLLLKTNTDKYKSDKKIDR